MNEDYHCSRDYNMDCPDKKEQFCSNNEYFHAMISSMEVDKPGWEDAGNGIHTYNSKLNKLLGKKYEGEKCKEHYLTLDYLLYSENNKIPNLDSKCHVERPTDSDGYDLSDHLPVSCIFEFSAPNNRLRHRKGL